MLLIVSITHIQLLIYGFSQTVSLFGSSLSMETYLGGQDLWFESHVITVWQSSSNLHYEVEMARLHQQIHFYISFAFVNSIGWGWVWCRAYFQHNRALTFRDRPWIFEFWTAPIRFCSNVIKTAICSYIYVIKTCRAVRYIKRCRTESAQSTYFYETKLNLVNQTYTNTTKHSDQHRYCSDM